MLATLACLDVIAAKTCFATVGDDVLIIRLCRESGIVVGHARCCWCLLDKTKKWLWPYPTIHIWTQQSISPVIWRTLPRLYLWGYHVVWVVNVWWMWQGKWSDHWPYPTIHIWSKQSISQNMISRIGVTSSMDPNVAWRIWQSIIWIPYVANQAIHIPRNEYL